MTRTRKEERRGCCVLLEPAGSDRLVTSLLLGRTHRAIALEPHWPVRVCVPHLNMQPPFPTATALLYITALSASDLLIELTIKLLACDAQYIGRADTNLLRSLFTYCPF